jgi:lactoylglutathione lyase
MKLRARFLERDGYKIELLCYEHPKAVGPASRRPMNQLGITHMAFVIDNIDKAIAAIVKHGGQLHTQTKIKSPKGDMAFCTDPDGGRIELWAKID